MEVILTNHTTGEPRDSMTNTPQHGQSLAILLVEADTAQRKQMLDAFDRYNRKLQVSMVADTANTPGFQLTNRALKSTSAGSLAEAQSALLEMTPDLVICSLELGGGEAMELFTKHDNTAYPLVMSSTQPGEELAVKAIKAGAIDYFVKTHENIDALPERIIQSLHEWQFMQEHQQLQHEVAELPRRQQQHLGQELHDGLGQQLTGLGLLAHSLVKRLKAAAPAELEMAEQLASGLDQALSDVRALSHGLMPVPMDARGLTSAIEELAARVSKQSGIRIELHHDKPILISDNETATHVFRIVQEAINNAIKHAEAKQITLLLEADEHQAVIEVRDDGNGLPADLDENQGVGFRTMFHRCKLFGGSLDIYTHDEGGTRVRCRFPLDRHKPAA